MRQEVELAAIVGAVARRSGTTQSGSSQTPRVRGTRWLAPIAASNLQFTIGSVTE